MSVSPVRFTSGVSTAVKGSTLFSLPDTDPTKIFSMFVDFTGQDYKTADWTVTETQAAATQSLIASDLAGEYGILRMVNAAGAADINSIQLTTVGTFINDPTKSFWLKGRVSRDNADETIGFGMQAVNATPFTVANGIWVSITGASTDAVFRVAKASTASTATSAAVYAASALNTFITLGMYYDGRGKEIKCYVNDVLKTTIDVSTTNNTPIVGLTPTISSQNTTANARNMDMDYFFFAVER